MCQRCEEAKKRLTPEQATELDQLNEQLHKLHARISELRGDPDETRMSQRFVEVCTRLDQHLIEFVKLETQRGTFGAEGELRAMLFCPALMLQCLRTCLAAGFDIEDTVQMFGTELQQALIAQSGELVQKLQLMRTNRGDGFVH